MISQPQAAARHTKRLQCLRNVGGGLAESTGTLRGDSASRISLLIDFLLAFIGFHWFPLVFIGFI